MGARQSPSWTASAACYEAQPQAPTGCEPGPAGPPAAAIAIATAGKRFHAAMLGVSSNNPAKCTVRTIICRITRLPGPIAQAVLYVPAQLLSKHVVAQVPGQALQGSGLCHGDLADPPTLKLSTNFSRTWCVVFSSTTTMFRTLPEAIPS